MTMRKPRPPADPLPALIPIAGILLAGLVQTASAMEPEPLERILNAARDFVTEALTTGGDTEARIEIGKLDSRLRLARCAHTPTARMSPGGRLSGRTTVNVRCSEPVSWSVFVPVTIERFAQVVVTARTLSRQQVIRADDLRLERMETSKLNKGYFTEIEPVLGLQTRRALTPGQILVDAFIAPRQLIKRGQQVTIYSAQPGIAVRMTGEALEDGDEGERIRVRNKASKRVVEGVVDADGRVRVGF